MKSVQRLITASIIAVSTLSLGACGSMSRQDRDTVTGAVIGGVAGSALTSGSTAGTVGGAVIGGIIGREARH